MYPKIYLAYGSNLNLDQMAYRCPTATILGTSELNGYRLLFRGGHGGAVATVEPYEGGVKLVGGTDSDHKIEGYPAILGTLDASDTAPIPTLEVGRVGGNVPRGFYYIIREWSREKGLNFSSESERGTFAYFVARKIARSGTKRSTAPLDIYSTPVEEAKAKINEILRESLSRTVRAALGGESVKGLKGAFN